MVAKENQTGDDPEIARLRAKTQDGALNVVGDILNDPRVQQIIKKALLRETVKNTIFLTCFLIGFLKIYDVTKTVIGFNWIVDFTVSTILIMIGSVYLIKGLFIRSEPDGDSTANDSDSRVC